MKRRMEMILISIAALLATLAIGLGVYIKFFAIPLDKDGMVYHQPHRSTGEAPSTDAPGQKEGGVE